MKRIRLSSRLVLAAVCCGTVAVGMVLDGCGSGGGSNTGNSAPGLISTGQTGFATRLSIAGRFTLPAATYTTLKSTQSAGILALGYTFDDANHSLVFNVKPLKSMFLRAGGQILGFTDANGLAKFKTLPAGTTSIDVVNNVTEAAILKFPASQLGKLDNPSKVTITQQTNLITAINSMDTMGLGRSAKGGQTRAEDGCGGDCGHATPPTCCLDYDGGVPAGTEHLCEFDPLKAYHFLGSTCGHWYWEGVCREGSEITGDEGVCLARHKGRWCEEINDAEFTATPDKTGMISTGDTVTITIHNKTRKNEIKVDLLDNFGNLETTTGIGALTGPTVTVRHYDGTGPFTYVPDRTVLYHAPATLPAGQSQVTVTVRLYGQTGATDIPIQVCHK